MRWQLKHFPADGNLPANKRREKARSAIDWKSAEAHPNLANKHDSMSFNFLQYSISHSIPHLPTLFHIPWHINYIGLSQIYRTEQSREFKCNPNSIKNFLHISVLSIHSYYTSNRKLIQRKLREEEIYDLPQHYRRFWQRRYTVIHYV